MATGAPPDLELDRPSTASIRPILAHAYLPFHSRGAGGPTLFDQLLKVALPLLQNLVFAPPGQDQAHTAPAYQNVVNTTTAAGPATAAPPGQRRKAVLMGLNYAGSSCPLRGCHNDVRTQLAHRTQLNETQRNVH